MLSFWGEVTECTEEVLFVFRLVGTSAAHIWHSRTAILWFWRGTIDEGLPCGDYFDLYLGRMHIRLASRPPCIIYRKCLLFMSIMCVVCKKGGGAVGPPNGNVTIFGWHTEW